MLSLFWTKRVVIGDAERGLVYRNRRFERVAIAADLQVEAGAAKRLRQLGVLAKVAVVLEVPAESAGLVFVDNTLVQVVGAGSYAFWNFQKNVAVETVELRVQSMEVSGQELLTRDKVSLRVNLPGDMRDILNGKLTVFGGLDGVLKQLVTLK